MIPLTLCPECLRRLDTDAATLDNEPLRCPCGWDQATGRPALRNTAFTSAPEDDPC